MGGLDERMKGTGYGTWLYGHVWLHLYLNGTNGGFAAQRAHRHLLDSLGGAADLWGGQALTDGLHGVPCHLQRSPGSLRAACGSQKGLVAGDGGVTSSPDSGALCDHRADL